MSSQKVKTGRSTDINLFNKSNEHIVPASNKVDSITKEVLTDLESEPVFDKYKSDSLESDSLDIDANGANNKVKT